MPSARRWPRRSRPAVATMTTSGHATTAAGEATETTAGGTETTTGGAETDGSRRHRDHGSARRGHRGEHRAGGRHGARGLGRTGRREPDRRPAVRHHRPRRPVVQRRRRRRPRPGRRAELGATGTESTPTSDGDRAERLAGLVAQGNDLVIGVGFLWRPALQAAAVERPRPAVRPHRRRRRRTTRARRTTSPTTSRCRTSPRCLFAEEQGSFLVGAAAALKSQTGTIGFIGGVETDLIKKFEAGYIAGAQAVNPDIEVLVAVHHPAAGLHRLQRPGQGQGDRRVDVRRRRRRHLRGRRRLRPRRVRGRQRGRRARRGLGHRRRQRPVQPGRRRRCSRTSSPRC